MSTALHTPFHLLPTQIMLLRWQLVVQRLMIMKSQLQSYVHSACDTLSRHVPWTMPWRGLAFHGPAAQARVCDVATALLTVLQRMHALGVIHRDVKLENIFIGELSPLQSHNKQPQEPFSLSSMFL